MNRVFWRNKKVLVTGHTGFKGSWLSMWLTMMGADVSGIALIPDTHPSLFEVLQLDKKMKSYIADIREFKNIEKIMRTEKPEIVFHLAAQPIVKASYENPIGTYETNVMGTVHILEAIRRCPTVKAVVNVTTDKVYENKEWCWGYREDDILNGYDPYSNSKSCSELVTSSYIKSFFDPKKYGDQHNTAIATARAGNVIGGGDWAKDRIIPDCVRAMEQKKQLILRNPDSTRPWQHVLEPLNGYLTLAEKLYNEGVSYNGAYNFGPDEKGNINVKTLIEKFGECYGEKNIVNTSSEINKVHEANLLKLDCSKAKNILEWSPKLSLYKTINYTAKWYKTFKEGNDILLYTTEQIQKFEKENDYEKTTTNV